MTDRRRRYRDISEEQLEEVVRGLPRREPSPGLRDRILSAAHEPRRGGPRRLAVAIALLAFLVLADTLVLRSQGATLDTPSWSVARTRAPSREEASLLREFGPVDLSVRIAALRPAESANGLELRAHMLTELGGG